MSRLWRSINPVFEGSSEDTQKIYRTDLIKLEKGNRDPRVIFYWILEFSRCLVVPMCKAVAMIWKNLIWSVQAEKQTSSVWKCIATKSHNESFKCFYRDIKGHIKNYCHFLTGWDQAGNSRSNQSRRETAAVAFLR